MISIRSEPELVAMSTFFVGLGAGSSRTANLGEVLLTAERNDAENAEERGDES